LDAFDLYGEGELFNFARGYAYVTALTNASQIWAMYCLVLFFHACHEELRPMRPLPKFICIKAIVFFSFWQSVAVSMLVRNGYLMDVADRINVPWQDDPNLVSHTLQDFSICVEMLVFAVAHRFAFSYKDFRRGGPIDKLVRRRNHRRRRRRRGRGEGAHGAEPRGGVERDARKPGPVNAADAEKRPSGGQSARATLEGRSFATLEGRSFATLDGRSFATLDGRSFATLNGQSFASSYYAQGSLLDSPTRGSRGVRSMGVLEALRHAHRQTDVLSEARNFKQEGVVTALAEAFSRKSRSSDYYRRPTIIARRAQEERSVATADHDTETQSGGDDATSAAATPGKSTGRDAGVPDGRRSVRFSLPDSPAARREDTQDS
jgi:hypothetical protein